MAAPGLSEQQHQVSAPAVGKRRSRRPREHLFRVSRRFVIPGATWEPVERFVKNATFSVGKLLNSYEGGKKLEIVYTAFVKDHKAPTEEKAQRAVFEKKDLFLEHLSHLLKTEKSNVNLDIVISAPLLYVDHPVAASDIQGEDLAQELTIKGDKLYQSWIQAVLAKYLEDLQKSRATKLAALSPGEELAPLRNMFGKIVVVPWDEKEATRASMPFLVMPLEKDAINWRYLSTDLASSGLVSLNPKEVKKVTLRFRTFRLRPVKADHATVVPLDEKAGTLANENRDPLAGTFRLSNEAVDRKYNRRPNDKVE